MPTDDLWIIARITDSRKCHRSVTKAVSDRLQGLLKDQLSERRNTPADLENIAKALIKDMLPASQKADAET